MATEAPVCHLPPEVDIPQPAPTTMPAIPPASLDPSSMLAAIQALTAGYNILANMQPPRPGSAAQDGQPGRPGQKGNSIGDFVQTNRKVSTVRVFNPDDHTQFVDVQVIDQLVLTESQTGKTWVFNR